MKNKISRNVDVLLKSIKKHYVTRAIEMRCISCGESMEKNTPYFRDGYHIQLCPKCREIHLVYKKYED